MEVYVQDKIVCSGCGKVITFSIKSSTPLMDHNTITCPNCNQLNSYHLHKDLH